MVQRQFNAISVDVEDWYHVCGISQDIRIARSDWRVFENTEKILRLFSGYGIKATFFMLGSIAEALPELAPMIAEQGHEIASHGYSHKLVTTLTAEEFRDEIRKTDQILQRQTGKKPAGFRAPQWSLSLSQTPWAFEILMQEGYLYDSSLSPVPLVGGNENSPGPYRLPSKNGRLLELPPLTVSTLAGRLPVGGGWGLRFFPQWLVGHAVKKYNAANWPAVLYIHPRELDPQGPRLELPALKRFASYGSRRDVSRRLIYLFERYSFSTMRDIFAACQTAY